MMIYIKRLISCTILISFLSTVHAASYKKDLLKAADTEANGEYVRGKFVSLMGKTFTDSEQKKILVIGDSHAQDFINMVYEGGYFDEYQVKTRHIPTHCQVDLKKGHEENIDEKFQTLCKESDSLYKAQDQVKQADIIILVANWKLWSAEDLPATIEAMHLTANQQLIILGRKSFGRVNLRKLLRKSRESLLSYRNHVDRVQEEINQLMKSTLSEDIYVDFQKTICEESNRCPLFTDDLKLITFDGGHLTKNGAAYIGKILFKDTLLKELLDLDEEVESN